MIQHVSPRGERLPERKGCTLGNNSKFDPQGSGISARKLEANRKNALKSTGPKTPRGKAISRRNALKHGMLAREVLITEGAAKESPAEFEQLLTTLQDHLQPVGPLEHMFVEKIAVCHWRLRRVYRAEAGIIRRQVDGLPAGVAVKKSADFRRIMLIFETDHDYRFDAEDLQDLEDRVLAHEQAVRGFQRHEEGIQFSRELLIAAESEVQKTGQVERRTERMLFACFGDIWLVRHCLLLRWRIERGNDHPKADDEPPLEDLRRNVLSSIKMEQERLKTMQPEVDKQEQLELSSTEASLSLPQAEDARRILLYEAQIERELYRAHDQLERLQRQRKGEVVPPPIKAELAVER